MASGQITVNGLTDDQFVKLIQMKDKSNGKLTFSLNSSIGSTGSGNVAGKTVVNNVTLNFSETDGAKFAAELFQMLAGG